MFRFSSFPDQVKHYANGANVLHLSPEIVENHLFPFAPKSLRTKYSDACSSIYKICDVLQVKNANLRQTRDLLLPKLVSGEVDVEGLDISIEGEQYDNVLSPLI
jgi:type I restriction enzyme, S subunit